MVKLRRSLWLLVVIPVCVMLPEVVEAQQSALPESQAAEIRQILVRRVDSLKVSPALVVGVIDENGSQVFAYGNLSEGSTTPADGETIFEIGSISKVFTTLLLADQVQRGAMSLDDPISKYLPELATPADSQVGNVKLVHLATHTSGLPRLPDNFRPANPKDPYADYDAARLYEYLKSAQLQAPAGSVCVYSNLGMGLLGHILTLASGRSYEAMLEETIFGPLRMSNTAVELNDEQQGRLAAGHNYLGEQVSHWNFQALAGAGAIRSTADDLLKFLAVNLGYEKNGLRDVLSLCWKSRAVLTGTDSVGLGWITSHRHGSRIIWHNGGTGGYRGFLGFCPEKGLGAVVLVNSERDCDDLGFHLLEPLCELKPLEPRRQTIEVAPEVLEKYAGIYDLSEDAKFTVAVVDGQLMVQLTGQESYPVYPSAENEFFYKVVDAQLTFGMDASGKVNHLVLHQNGVDQMCVKRGESFVPQGSGGEIILSPAQMIKYEGEYQLQPGVKFYVTVQGSRLMVQLTGQPAVQVYPESDTEFFYKVVDARITFEMDASGKVTGLVLHQGGRDLAAAKIH